MAIDELSLIREGPVRVKIGARDIDKIRGCVEIFINKQGHEIRFIPEEDPKRTPLPKRPLRNQEPDGSDEEEDERDSEDDWTNPQNSHEVNKPKSPRQQNPNSANGGK